MKTKILRYPGCERYWKKHLDKDGDGFVWEQFEKDKSALFREYHASKFKSSRNFSRSPSVSYDQPLRPIPPDFETDLLGDYAALDYATGHKPLAPLRLR